MVINIFSWVFLSCVIYITYDYWKINKIKVNLYKVKQFIFYTKLWKNVNIKVWKEDIFWKNIYNIQYPFT